VKKVHGLMELVEERLEAGKLPACQILRAWRTDEVDLVREQEDVLESVFDQPSPKGRSETLGQGHLRELRVELGRSASARIAQSSIDSTCAH
jgi:hypothetical protein